MVNCWKGCVSSGLVMGCMILLTTVSLGSEPERPEFDSVLDKAKENAIQKTSRLSPTEAFEKLKHVDYIAEEYFLRKTIFRAFQHRRNAGIEMSLRKLALPEKEFTKGSVFIRTADIYVAKKIFEVFQEESIPKLLKLYESGDAVTKGNVIRVSGGLAGAAVDRLLIEALHDKTVCEQEDPEVDGSPMRICDLAYNQLVVRFQVKNVLRTIGPIHRVDNRDFHIATLKGRLQS